MLTGRSYDPPRPRRTPSPGRLALAVALALSVTILVPVASMGGGGGDGSSAASRSQRSWPPVTYPEGMRVEAARAFAAAAPGTVAFAVEDANGGVRGLDQDSQFSSASVSKVLLLAAELRRLARADEEVDEGTRALLDSMITISDNDAASGVYARVGDAGMEEIAAGAGMRSFEVTPGYWGGAQVTAADLARFFYDLDRNLPARYRAYGKRLLANVTSSQRWGIPAGASGDWRVYFKGGWRPTATIETSGPVTHQAALLVHRSGQRIAIAVLTDQSPGATSFATLEGITTRLLAEDPSTRRWPAP
jgi:beta-lactamase class A